MYGRANPADMDNTPPLPEDDNAKEQTDTSEISGVNARSNIPSPRTRAYNNNDNNEDKIEENNDNVISKRNITVTINTEVPRIVTPDQLSPKGSPREDKQRKDDEIRILHRLIEQKRLEKVKRESIGRERSRTEEEIMLDAMHTMQLDNEIKKAEKKEEALFLKRDAEERAEAEDMEEVQEILESPAAPGVELAPNPELIEEARREGMPIFKPTHTRSNFSLLPSSIQRAPLAIAIPAMLSKSPVTSPPLPPKSGQTPPGSPLSLQPAPLGRPSLIIPTSPSRSPLASPVFPVAPVTPTTPPSPSTSTTPVTPSIPTTPLPTPPSTPPSTTAVPNPGTPFAAPPGITATGPLLPSHALRAKHQKPPSSAIEIPTAGAEEFEPVKSAVDLLKEQLAAKPNSGIEILLGAEEFEHPKNVVELLKEQLIAIEASITHREARIKAQERELEQLRKLTQKHQPTTLPKHLEICIVFDVSVSWMDKFVESVTDLLDELKTLYEYKINFSLVECGGPKRFLDFQSIEDTAKIQEWLSNIKRCKGENVDLVEYCIAMSKVASLSWSEPKWTRILLFFSGETTTVGIPDAEEKLQEVLPQIQSLKLCYYFIRLLGKGDIKPFEKYLRNYNDLDKGLLMTEVRDGPSIVHDLVKKAMSRVQKRENSLFSPPEQLVHRLMTWEIIESTVYMGEQAKTQIRRVFCKRYNFPFRSFPDLVLTLNGSLWNIRDANGNLTPAPPLECVRVPAKFEVYAMSDGNTTTTRYMEMKNFKKQDAKFAVRQFKTKDENGQLAPAEDCYYYSVLDMQQTASYFAIEFNAHMNVFFPGISPLLFPESFVVMAPQNVPGSNIFLAEQQFPKYNVIRTLTPERDAYVQTFSHFSYCVSGGLLLIDSICWIQETNMYTKYVIHAPTLKGRFDLPSNEGEEGIVRFFERHVCNDMCSTLKLMPHPRQGRTRRALASDFAQRLVPKPPASPSASTTNLLNTKSPTRLEKGSGGSFRSAGNLLSSSNGASNSLGGMGSQSHVLTWQVDIVMGLALEKLFAAGGGTWEQYTEATPSTAMLSIPQTLTNGKSPGSSKRNKGSSNDLLGTGSPISESPKSSGLFSSVTKFLSGSKPPEPTPISATSHPYKQVYQQQIHDYQQEQQRQIQELQHEQAELKKHQRRRNSKDPSLPSAPSKSSPPASPKHPSSPKKQPSSPKKHHSSSSSPTSSRHSSPSSSRHSSSPSSSRHKSSLPPMQLDPPPLPQAVGDQKLSIDHKPSKHSRSHDQTTSKATKSLFTDLSSPLASTPASLPPTPSPAQPAIHSTPAQPDPPIATNPPTQPLTIPQTTPSETKP